MMLLIFLSFISASELLAKGVSASSLKLNGRLVDEDLTDHVYVRPIVRHPDTIDKNFNGIQDGLETMIQQVAKANADTLIPVVVTLFNPVSEIDLHCFTMLGGHVTNVYRYVTYGFAGVIPAAKITAFAEMEGGNLAVVEQDKPLRYHLDVSVALVRVRPLVWQTYGYLGSPNQSIAIIDSGIDDSHPDVGPYEDLNFSKKMIGWYDATPDGAVMPQDFGEHGTHVAGIAAGTGAANTLQGSGNIETTFTYILPPERHGPWVNGYVDYFDVMSPGIVKLNCSWDGGNDVLLVLSDPVGNEVKRTSGTSQPLILTYDTSGTSYPTGRYEVFVGNIEGSEGTPFSCIEIYPYQGLNDGYNLFTGMAPNSKLVGVKVFDNTGFGSISYLLDGMDWIIENKVQYHIVVASMSLGLVGGATNSTLDQKVDTLVKNGITTTISAGNDFPYNTIGSPGTAAYVITVAATNDENGITDYSSNGDASKNEYGLIKPDVAASGGTFQPAYGNKILSADSNDVDAAYTGYADRNADDYQQMAGTSMAAPHVAGLAALIAEAMGEWDWTLEEALKVKMLISMTSFETQNGEGTNLPTLDRGGKDSKEGYGRISADAAMEAATMNYSIGEFVSETFEDAPWEKKVWARQVLLSANTTYEFHLSVPSGADYDLYLYDGSPDAYGQPVILERSVNASTGFNEALCYTPTYSKTAYILTKWVSGSGMFNLTSTFERHDVALVSVEPSAVEVYSSRTVNITVVVKNNGNFTETFEVTTYHNGSAIETKNVTDLTPKANATLIFTWNTSDVSPGYYVISATAETVPYESDILNNTFTDSTIHIKIPGDVNGDRVVDLFDAATISAHWYPGPPIGPLGYDEESDINLDGRVDIFDAAIVSANWMKSE